MEPLRPLPATRRGRAAIHAPEGWQQKSFDDAGWKAAVAWAPDSGRTQTPLGHPWIPDSVKALRHV